MCDQLADILVQLAAVPIPAVQVTRKLSSNREARNAIARSAIRVCPDLWIASRFKDYGLADESDVPFLLSQLDSAQVRNAQETIAFLIAAVLYGVPWSDMELIERVLTVAKFNPILLAALEPVLGPVELGSEEAESLKAQFESLHGREDPEDPMPVAAPAPNLDDLLPLADNGENIAFVKICYRLAGDSWYPGQEVLPGWEDLQPAVQSQIVRSAEMYLNGYCVANTSWIDTGEGWYIPNRDREGAGRGNNFSQLLTVRFERVSPAF